MDHTRYSQLAESLDGFPRRLGVRGKTLGIGERQSPYDPPIDHHSTNWLWAQQCAAAELLRSRRGEPPATHSVLHYRLDRSLT